jgi:ribonuclease HI
VISRHCLTTIDHDSPGNNKLFLTCDASNSGTGAILSWGPSWKESRPVAFDSQHYTGAQRHYPTHEQELLAIIRALRKWRSDILGMHVELYTDHRTLLNFDTQKDLSRRQARWMEFLSQYDYTFHYIAGTLNTAADALSRLPIVNSEVRDDRMMIATTFLADLPMPQ